MRTEVSEIIGLLEELKQDSSNKRLKEKAEQIITLLKQDSNLALEKARFILEEVESSELSSYHRTKVWDVISALESAKMSPGA